MGKVSRSVEFAVTSGTGPFQVVSAVVPVIALSLLAGQDPSKLLSCSICVASSAL